MGKKIFVLYGPGGNGHRSGAKMVKETLNRKYPEHEVIIKDVNEIANMFLKFTLGVYDNLLKADPKYVKYGYHLLNNIKTDKVMTPVFPGVVNILAKWFKEFQPDIIISVHSAINSFIVEAMKKLNWFGKKPFVILCTDMTDNFLNGWVNKDADLLIGFLEVTKRQLIDYGMPEHKIKVLGGPPVNPVFLDTHITKAQARQNLGLDPDTFTVFIMSGGVGLKTIYKFTRQLINSSLPVQLLVCCGTNDRLKEKVDKVVRYTKKNVKVFGFTNQIHSLMSAADVIVTKPGPGVIAEAIIKELPIVLDGVSEIMPQEAGNVEYVLSNGVGKKVGELNKFHNHIASFIFNGEELEKMRANMIRLKKTESSAKLADWISRIANEGVTEEFLNEKEDFLEVEKEIVLR